MRDNCSGERASFVTHLECAWSGEPHEADRLHGLSRAGRPLVVRNTWRRWRARSPSRRWRTGRRICGGTGSCCPCAADNIVSLGETMTPLICGAAPRRRPSAAATSSSRTRGGCRPARSRRAAWPWPCRMAKELGVRRIAMPTAGNAGAALAAYAAAPASRPSSSCPDDTPEVTVYEIALHGAQRLSSSTASSPTAAPSSRTARRPMGWFTSRP